MVVTKIVQVLMNLRVNRTGLPHLLSPRFNNEPGLGGFPVKADTLSNYIS